MPNITLSGRIKRIFPSEVIGNFEKRILWLEETEGQYPNTYNLEFQQGACNKLDNFKPGQTVTCSVDVRGRYWSKNEKEGVMNTLKCWKIEADQQARPAPASQQGFGENYNDNEDFPPTDDLPF